MVNDDPLDEYRVALRRARLRKAGLVAAFVVGLPCGGAFGFVANRVLFGDYGASSLLAFVFAGALVGASACVGLTRLVA